MSSDISPLSDLLHSVWQSLGSSMLLKWQPLTSIKSEDHGIRGMFPLGNLNEPQAQKNNSMLDGILREIMGHLYFRLMGNYNYTTCVWWWWNLPLQRLPLLYSIQWAWFFHCWTVVLEARFMLGRTKAIGHFQFITSLLSNTFLGTCRFGEKMAFIPPNLFLFRYQEPVKKMMGSFFLWWSPRTR